MRTACVHVFCTEVSFVQHYTQYLDIMYSHRLLSVKLHRVFEYEIINSNSTDVDG